MQRIDENFSGWSDFKAFMDQSFADALRAGTDAVHAADPTALAAIEGGQIPGWGGYDYSRLRERRRCQQKIYEGEERER